MDDARQAAAPKNMRATGGGESKRTIIAVTRVRAQMLQIERLDGGGLSACIRVKLMPQIRRKQTKNLCVCATTIFSSQKVSN